MALESSIPCSCANVQPPSLLSGYRSVNEYALAAERDGQLKTSSATGILMGSTHTRHKNCHVIGLLFLWPCHESFNLATFYFLSTDRSYHPQIRSGPYSVPSRGSCDDVLLEVFTLGGFPIPTTFSTPLSCSMVLHLPLAAAYCSEPSEQGFRAFLSGSQGGLREEV